METNTQPEIVAPVESVSPATYRRIYGRSMMVLKKLRGEIPASDELCHITSVNTLAPGLWITVKFLDGSINSFRPELIQLAEVPVEHPASVS